MRVGKSTLKIIRIATAGEFIYIEEFYIHWENQTLYFRGNLFFSSLESGIF